MTTRKGDTETPTTDTETSNIDTETSKTDATAPETAPPTAPPAAETAGIPGNTGDVIDGNLTIVGDETELAPYLADLKALGKVNPDVNVVAVQSAHGTWTWTARAADDGRKLAVGGPHHAARLAENLKLLLSAGSTIALHTTGSDTVHQLA